MSYKIESDFPVQTILKSLHILYVEDEDPIRDSVTKVLKYFSSHVLSVESAEAAMHMYENYRPNIVICDINLPGMSGIDFVKWIREFDKKSQVFLLTAYTDKDYLMEAVKLNLVDYIVKPVDFDLLEKTLKNAARELIQCKSLSVDFNTGATYCYQQRSVKMKDTIHVLTAKEVKLIDYLIINKKRMTSKEELINYLWEDDDASESAFKSLMNKLRTKIGKEAIQNISGVGYQLLINES